MSKIVKVESRSKACFDYAETHPIFDAKQSKIVKVESRSKACSVLHGSRLSLSLAVAEDRMRFGNGNQTSLLPLLSPFTIFAPVQGRCGQGGLSIWNFGYSGSMKDIRRLIAYMARYRGHVALNIFFNLLYVLTSFFSIALVAPFVSVLFGLVEETGPLPAFRLDPDVLMQYAYHYIGMFQAQHGIMSGLLLVSVAFVLATLISNVFRYFAFYNLAYVRSGMLRDLRQNFYSHVMSLPLSYFSEKKKGDLLSRVNMDIPDVEWAIVASLQGIIMEPLYVVMFAIGLFALDYKLTLLVLVAFPVILYVIGKVGSRLKSRSEKVQAMLGQMVSMVEEGINGIRIIKSFNLIDVVGKNFENYNKQYVRALNGVYRRRDLSSPLTEILLVAVTMGVLGFGGTRVLSGQMSPDLFVLYILLLIKIISPSKHVVTSFYSVQKGRAALGRIQQVIDEIPREEESPEALVKKEFLSDIRYQDVSFHYADSETMVLQHVNLKIEKGKTYALVGASGAGKTTMVDLLSRFYDVSEGSISIDGVDIRDLKLEDLRDLVGTVGQHPFVWHDTVANNIRFGMENVSMDEVMEAAKKANAHDFIMALPQGYDTVLGDAGMTVSGGQRQRITIARAILKNAPVLVLDEATSALDAESEVLVQEALSKLMEGRTSIVIAHRLSTIRNADHIVVFEKGRIVEEGCHQELLAKGGHYAHYVNLQNL